MTDWADEIAIDIFITESPEYTEESLSKIATALRKAKADGMRELIKKVDDQQEIYTQKIALLEAEGQDDYIKMKIERTENYMEALRYISEYWEDEASKLESPTT